MGYRIGSTKICFDITNTAEEIANESQAIRLGFMVLPPAIKGKPGELFGASLAHAILKTCGARSERSAGPVAACYARSALLDKPAVAPNLHC
jgi:hypothetical protein